MHAVASNQCWCIETPVTHTSPHGSYECLLKPGTTTVSPTTVPPTTTSGPKVGKCKPNMFNSCSGPQNAAECRAEAERLNIRFHGVTMTPCNQFNGKAGCVFDSSFNTIAWNLASTPSADCGCRWLPVCSVDNKKVQFISKFKGKGKCEDQIDSIKASLKGANKGQTIDSICIHKNGSGRRNLNSDVHDFLVLNTIKCKNDCETTRQFIESPGFKALVNQNFQDLGLDIEFTKIETSEILDNKALQEAETDTETLGEMLDISKIIIGSLAGILVLSIVLNIYWCSKQKQQVEDFKDTTNADSPRLKTFKTEGKNDTVTLDIKNTESNVQQML